jgi:glycosyltransferase involved in cell wall biosynthesis
MKILVQNHSDHSGPLHGAERAILEIIDDWAKKSPGLEFVFISKGPAGSFAQEVVNRGWKVYPLQFPWWIGSNEPRPASEQGAQFLADMAAVSEVRAIFRLEKPDIALTNTIVAPWTAIVASMEHVPHIWFAHEYGELGKDLIYRYGNEDSYTSMGELSELVVANSLATKKFLSSWIAKRKLVIQLPAVSSARIHISSDAPRSVSIGEPPAAFKIGVIGHLTEAKNQLAAVQAVKRVVDNGHDVELVLAGERDANYWLRVASYIGAHELENRVTFAGELETPFDLMSECDLILAPSLQESFGLVVLESQFLGKPVVATDNGGCAEIIIHGKTGLLVDTKSVEKVADAITRYLKNPELLVKHGIAGKIHAQELLAGANLSSTSLLSRVLAIAKSPSTVIAPRFISHWIDQLDIVADSLDLNSLAEGRGEVSARKVLVVSFPMRVLRKLGRESTAFLKKFRRPMDIS